MKKIISLILFLNISLHIPTTYAQFDVTGESDFQTKPIKEIKGNNTIPGTISFQPFVTITTGFGIINVMVWYQDSNGYLINPPIWFESYYSSTSPQVADFDLDGRADIVVAQGGWNTISVLQQNEFGQLNDPVLFDIPYPWRVSLP